MLVRRRPSVAPRRPRRDRVVCGERAARQERRLDGRRPLRARADGPWRAAVAPRRARPDLRAHPGTTRASGPCSAGGARTRSRTCSTCSRSRSRCSAPTARRRTGSHAAADRPDRGARSRSPGTPTQRRWGRATAGRGRHLGGPGGLASHVHRGARYEPRMAQDEVAQRRADWQDAVRTRARLRFTCRPPSASSRAPRGGSARRASARCPGASRFSSCVRSTKNRR